MRSGSVAENVYDAFGRRGDDRALRRAAGTARIHRKRDRRGGRPQRRGQPACSTLRYDATGQLRFTVQVIEPNVGSAGKHSVSEQRYDALGQLVESRAYATAVGHLTAYDELTIAAAIVPDAVNDRRSAIAYDAGGRQAYTVRELRDRIGQQIRRDEARPRRTGPTRPAHRLCLARGADAVRHGQHG